MATVVMIHSLWRWLVVVGALAALVGTLVARRGGAPSWTMRVAKFYSIALDIQVLLGVIIWVGRSWWVGDAFFAYIHPVTMILALGMAHMGTGRERRAQAEGKGGAALLPYLASILLLAIGIPWFR